MNLDLSPVVRSLLNDLSVAGFKIVEIIPDNDTSQRVPRLQKDLVKLICDSHMVDVTVRHGVVEYWLRLVMDNEPCAIVSDYTAAPILDRPVQRWYDGWENIVWIPSPAKQVTA